jgi:hypothetical protein
MWEDVKTEIQNPTHMEEYKPLIDRALKIAGLIESKIPIHPSVIDLPNRMLLKWEVKDPFTGLVVEIEKDATILLLIHYTKSPQNDVVETYTNTAENINTVAFRITQLYEPLALLNHKKLKF